jgi:AcrR family transcriptional regulator
LSQEMEKWLEDLISLTDEENKMTEKQARILQAAVEIFSEKGYAATSTSEIAQKAGVAEGTIFRHYKTKKDLLISIIGPIMAKTVAPFFLKDFAKLLNKPYDRVEDFYRVIVRDRMKFARSNIKLLKILIHEIPFHPELQGHVQALFTQHLFQHIERLVKHFQEQGQLMEAPSWRIIRSSASMVLGLVFTHVFLMPEFPVNEEEEIEWAIDTLLHGIAKRE